MRTVFAGEVAGGSTDIATSTLAERLDRAPVTPIRTFPSTVLVEATTEGVERLSTRFLITADLLPSMIAIKKFVVPKLIPSILAIKG